VKLLNSLQERFTKRIWLLCFATILTLTSVFLVSGILPNTSKSILYTIDYRYANRNKALISLSNFESREFNSEEGIITYTGSKVTSMEYGFTEMLSLIRQNRPIPFANNYIKEIMVIHTGSAMRIGTFDASQQYLIGVGIENPITRSKTFESISLMWEGELASWVQIEEKNALNTISLVLVTVVVLIELVLSIRSELE